jgi:predicted O-linked N-acetylglucosamine transferase (SPINDLY family)
LVFRQPARKPLAVFDAYLQHHFAPLGVEIARRVLRLPQLSRADFLAVLAHSDLALDSFGFSGGNTSLDALSVGLPVLTLPGEFMRGRQTMAMLRCLSERVSVALLAADAADYASRASQLLADATARAELRAAILASKSQLFDDPARVGAPRLATCPADRSPTVAFC